MKLATRQEIELELGEAGCLIYVADASTLIGTKGTGPITGGELYQDDGYSVRLVLGGELTDEEQANWTSRAEAAFQLPSGEMIVSGILDPDFDRWAADFGSVSIEDESGGEHELGCRVALPPGNYRVTFYGYPPNDLAGGGCRSKIASWTTKRRPTTSRARGQASLFRIGSHKAGKTPLSSTS